MIAKPHANGGQLLFRTVSRFYGRTSVIVTTNLTSSDWPGEFRDPDSALLYAVSRTLSLSTAWSPSRPLS
jgi:hypothetical protein